MNINASLLIGLTATVIAFSPAAAQEQEGVTLETALVLFGQNNLDLKLARAEASALSGDARQAAAYPNPTMEAIHEPLSDGDVTSSESYLNVSQRIVWPGTRVAVGRASTHRIEAARYRLVADSVRLAFEVKKAFVEAVRAESFESVLTRATAVFREGDRSAEERYVEGDVSRYDRQRIRVERIRYEARLAEAVLAGAATRRRLALLVVPEGDPLALELLDGPVGMPASVDDGRLRAIRRADVLGAESLLEYSAASASATRRSRIPDLVATGGHKTQSDGLTGAFLSVSIALPLWDRRGGAVEAAQARVAAANHALALTRLQVENEVASAAQTYRSLVRQAELLAEPAQDGMGLLDMASASYREGEMELIELLDAAEAHVDAELAGARLRADLWISYYNLERAVGGFDVSINDQEGRR